MANSGRNNLGANVTSEKPQMKEYPYIGTLTKISKNLNIPVDNVLHKFKGNGYFLELPRREFPFSFFFGHGWVDHMCTTKVKDIEHHMTDCSLNFWTHNSEYKLEYRSNPEYVPTGE